MQAPQVLITRPIFPETIARLSQHFDVDVNASETPLSKTQLISRLRGKYGVLTIGGDRIDAEVLQACPDLRICANFGVGYDNLDVPSMTRMGIVATNAPDVLTESTADFAFTLLMATARRVTEGERFLRAGLWKQGRYDLFAGAEVHGTTLGIVGMGRIGQAVARRAALGFGMKVLYNNRTRIKAESEQSLGARFVSKDELLRDADHVLLTLPFSTESRHTIGTRELNLMKPSAILINVARGGIVDDAALARALRERRIAAAGLDVFEGEPHVSPELLEIPNTVLTPHIASSTTRTRRAMAELAADNLIDHLLKGTARTPVNPEAMS
jgi:gluconate 2-dehydrogenase